MIQNYNFYKDLGSIYNMSKEDFEKGIGLKQGVLDFVKLIPNQDNDLLTDLPGIKDFLRVQRVKLIKVFVDELIERCKQVSTMKSLGDANLGKYVEDLKTYVCYMGEIYRDMGLNKTIDESVKLFCEKDTYEYKKYKEAQKIVKELGK